MNICSPLICGGGGSTRVLGGNPFGGAVMAKFFCEFLSSLFPQHSTFEVITQLAGFVHNLLAPAALAQRAGAHWIALRQPGSIVNVASTSGLKGKPILVAYSSSKGAMMRFTEALAAEWARHEIRVNTIAPGAFDTAAQSAVTADAKTLDSRLKKIPLRRMGTPDELGPLVCYLLSPLSSFVTGACFVIDGGEVAKL